jgi:uncharacterized metal-binding protein YceD (DUF177 family)
MELRFKIKEIPADGAPLHVRRAISSELLGLVLEGTDGDLSKAAVELDANLVREHDDVIVTGRLRGSFVVPCGRCVEPAKVPVDVRIDGLFQREGTVQDPKDAESLLDSPDVFEHDGISILLDEAVRELLIAELPIAPVCKWSCKGLCATCGANLNSESCGHKQDDPLPEQPKALAGLANIKLQS